LSLDESFLAGADSSLRRSITGRPGGFLAMLVARSFARGVGRNGRAMSSIVEASPRATIAQNIVAFNKIAHAHDDSALAAATQAVKIDVNNLQPELEGLQGYLSAGPVAGTAAFVKDPSAWQNMAVGEYVSTEAGRADTWPFLVGGM